MRVGAIGAIFLFSIAQPALCDDCDRAVGAIIKTDHVPSYSVSTDDELGIKVQSIFTGAAIYIKSGNDDWSSEQKTGDELEAEFRHVHEGAKWSCEATGTESVDGDPADIISVHNEDRPSQPNSRYWISQASGLLLKTELYASLGPKVFQIIETYDYKNIPSPPK